MYRNKRNMLRMLILSALLLMPCLRDVYGQGANSAIFGTITDETGGLLAGVTITVKNLDTGIARVATTDDSGLYRVPGLSPGQYEVKAELSGFTTGIRTGIILTVGRESVVNLTLKVGEITERVEVTGDAPMVETRSGALSGLVTEKQIIDLPLNGRDYLQLALLEPGVVTPFNAGANPFTAGGQIGRLTANGVRASSNNFMLDATDINDAIFNQTPGGTKGITLGVEAIREFQILTANYSAEFGRSAGASINAVTKSGTNEFHGSLFEFHRNSALDARNFFDLPRQEAKRGGLPEIPPFRRNQFGGSFGGPIIKDKTFFFLTYEGLRERLGVTSVASVPNAQARRGILPDPENPGRSITVNVDPKVVPFLNFYPLPNGRDFGDGTALWSGSATQPSDENMFVVRIDHSFSDKDSIFARYLFDDSFSVVPFGSSPVPGFPFKLDHRNQYLTIQEKKIIRPNLLNEFRFAYNRTQESIPVPPVASPELSTSLLPGPRPLGQISTRGLSPIGNQIILPIAAVLNLFEYADSLVYSKGRHSIKAGLDFKRMQANDLFDALVNGQFVFPNLQSFLTNQPFVYVGVLPGSSSDRAFRQTFYDLYFQDDIQLSQGFTLNLGLRFEYQTLPSEANGKLVNLRDVENDATTTLGEIFKNPTPSWAPRFGFAWDPWKNGKTSIRGGFGLFYDFIWENLYGNTRFLPPFFVSTLIIGPSFPRPVAGTFIPINPLIFPIQFDIERPYTMQFNLSIQREILPDTVVNARYVGSRGIHLFHQPNANAARPVIRDSKKFFPEGLAPRNPNFGPIFIQRPDAQSFYNSFQLSVNRRFSGGLQFQAAYTLAKSIDDASAPFFSDFANNPSPNMDPDDTKLDRGLSAFDVRHNFVLNYIYDLPFGPGKRFGANLNGFIGKLIGGWQFSGIVQFAAGNPFTILVGFNRSRNLTPATSLTDRPNLRPGRSNNPTKGFRRPEKWFDPTAFELQPAGFFGNLGRNTVIGPGFNNFDFSLTKNNRVNEDINLQFRVEFFNIFNHPNFSTPNNVGEVIGAGGGGDIVFADESGVPVGNAGQIFKTVNTSRQIQFALRIEF